MNQKREEAKYPYGPWVLGLLVFVVVGSGRFHQAQQAQLTRDPFLQPFSKFSKQPPLVHSKH